MEGEKEFVSPVTEEFCNLDLFTLSFEYDLDVDVFWDLDPHELAKCPFVGCDVDEPLMHPHFPVIPGCGSVATWTLPCGNDQLLCWKWYGPGDAYTCPFCDGFYLVTDSVQIRRTDA